MIFDHQNDLDSVTYFLYSIFLQDATEVVGPCNFYLSIVKEKHVPFMISTLVNDGRTGTNTV